MKQELKEKELPPITIKELETRVGNFEAKKFAETLLNGTMEQKQEVVKDLELDTIKVCQHCGKLITEGYEDEDDYSFFCSKECAVAEVGQEYFDKMLVDEYGNGSIFWTTIESEEDLS